MFSLASRPREGRFGPIGNAFGFEDTAPGSAVTILFDAGQRPAARDIHKLARASGEFEVTSLSAPDGRYADVDWLELLINGLTFDLTGLVPAPSRRAPPCRHAFGTDVVSSQGQLEGICLQPGPHLAGGSAMPPVVRSLAWIGALLARLPGVRAVVWHTAQIWSAPDYFHRTVVNWIEGGVFPGFGLTALVPVPEQGIRSEGLSAFIGAELHVLPDVAGEGEDAAKLALRLVHWLVEHGGLDSDVALTGPAGEPIVLRPDRTARVIRASRSV